jgi:hypothetical protein
MNDKYEKIIRFENGAIRIQLLDTTIIDFRNESDYEQWKEWQSVNYSKIKEN